MQKPFALKPDSLIRLVAPAGPFDRREFSAGVKVLQSFSWNPVWNSNLFEKKEYLAGTDSRRHQELARALLDTKTDALFAVRGGYGTLRALQPTLPVSAQPKLVIGLSDITVLLLHLTQQHQWVTFYGPMVAPHFGRKPKPAYLKRIRKLLTEPKAWEGHVLKGTQTLRDGTAEGPLTGGCLTLLSSLLGTPEEPDFSGKIIFLEDVNEAPYRVDRMLTQLLLAGKFRGVRGIACGTLDNAAHVIKERLAPLKIPILWGLKAGHCPEPDIIPFGVKARISGKNLVILESPLRPA